MANNDQIFLFFKERTIYDPTKFASSILDLFSDIGQPVILPFQVGSEEEVEQPVFVFDKVPEIQIVGNFYRISIQIHATLNQHYVWDDIITSIYPVLEQFGISISRIGYILNRFSGLENVSKVKEEIFKSDELLNSEDFQVSWYQKATMNHLQVNFWKKYMIFHAESDYLLTTYDVNTLVNMELPIDKKFVISFIDDVKKLLD